MSQPQNPNPWPEINRRTTDYWTKMGRLNLWTGILGRENLEREADLHYKNREAEEAHVRKSAWGAGGEESAEDDEMRQTVLGDINHPAPIIMPQPQSSLPTIAALAATLAVGGLLGYAMTKGSGEAPAQEAPEFDDSSVSIGLGRIEDYIKEGK